MYSKYFINTSSIIISIIITIITAIFIQKIDIKTIKLDTDIGETNQIQNSVEVSIEENVLEQNIVEENMAQNTIKSDGETKSEEEIWQLMIPKIDLIAPINEGTEQATISKTIGHFTETSIWDGNVGLASHNRGMRANFFEDIKNLVKNDLIIYQKGEDIRQYEVTAVNIIQDNDWSYLQKTNDNRITLITCIKNQPNYRLCVQGVEI